MVDTLKIERHAIEKSRITEVDFDNIQFGRVYSDHMFVADFLNGEWQNFTIQPYGDLNLSPATFALHYGQSIFEGLKAYRSQDAAINVFRPIDNFKRMNISAKRMCIPELPEEVFIGGMTELLKMDRNWAPKGDGNSLYIRPIMFAIDEYIGLRPTEKFKFIIFTCPVGAYYSEPVEVKVERKYVRAFPGGTGFAKAAGNYAGSMYPTELAHDEGYDQLIWTDGIHHENIEEAGTMNLMFIVDGVLLAPDPKDTVLRSITGSSTLKLAEEWGLKTEVRRISVSEIIDAIETGRLTEAFGVGTAATIAQISTISCDGKDYLLPPVEKRVFSSKVYQYLENLKTGKIEDQFDWIYKV
ncbi:branched-chain amino acid aminotransferase [Bacteroidota bacterium]